MSLPYGKCFLGTSGLVLPVSNKLFYPAEFRDKSRLFYYSSLMNSIEINSSFYKIPKETTVAKWAVEVPDSFKFTFKLFREITHNKLIAFDEAIVRQFFKSINQVNEKKGCILVQFPPSVRLVHLAQLEKLLFCLRENDKNNEWNIAIEFRYKDLYQEEVYHLLEKYGMSLVLHDKSNVQAPLHNSTADFVYLRFHGPDGNYRGSYENDVLAEYASYVTEWLTDGKDVFVYFNNTIGDAIGNLESLRGEVLKQ